MSTLSEEVQMLALEQARHAHRLAVVETRTDGLEATQAAHATDDRSHHDRVERKLDELKSGQSAQLVRIVLALILVVAIALGLMGALVGTQLQIDSGGVVRVTGSE